MTSAISGPPRRICFDQHHTDGVLTVYPEGDGGVPFCIRRVFTIVGVSANGRRGKHAHRRCSQLHACLAGRVDVEITNGTKEVIEIPFCQWYRSSDPAYAMEQYNLRGTIDCTGGILRRSLRRD